MCFVFFLRIRLPPRSTRTDTLFPYTTLFRSGHAGRLTDPGLNPDRMRAVPRRGTVEATAVRPAVGPAEESRTQRRSAPWSRRPLPIDRKSTRLNYSH